MPRPLTLSAIPPLSALACAAVLALSLPAHASDAHAAPAKEPAVKQVEVAPAAAAASAVPAQLPAKAEPAGHGKAEPAAHGKAAPAPAEKAAPAMAKAPPADPLDRVRERLAEKLGAHAAPNAGSPNVLRVAAHANASAHDAAPAPRPRRPSAVLAEQMAAASHGAADAAAPVVHAPHWDYQGAGGPESWGKLQAEFSKCSVGTRQSPIDIRDGVKVQLDPVQFDYKPSGFRVIDNGHTVQVNVSSGNSIEVLGRRYDLVQFHFHRPSEERINGRQFDMVAHLVHKDIDGRLAVVAVLLDRGSIQPVVQTVWNNLPLEKGEDVAAKVALDLNALLPADRSYFTYMGSLTTPPCSEGVLWMVMKNPVSISAEQINIFARLYPMNARPIQQVSGRLIKESN
jgi:carbonic anhydrase